MGFAAALVVVLAQAHAGSLSLNAKFAAFKHSHGKQYTDAFQEAYRKGIFAANLAKINQHNVEHANGEHSWTMGVNQFADLTHDEFMAMNTLSIPDMPAAPRKYSMQAKSMASSVDWRDSGAITEIKDQKKCGSTVQMSEQQVVDCDTRDGGCNGGWYDTAWRYVSEEGGIATQSDYPYTARDGSCRASSMDFVSGVSGCVGGPNFSVITTVWLETKKNLKRCSTIDQLLLLLMPHHSNSTPVEFWIAEASIA